MKNFLKSLITAQCLTGIFILLGVFLTNPLASQCNAVSGSIRGHVFTDYDNNGVKALTEFGMSGVEVNLYDHEGDLIQTKSTDDSGNYSFSSLVDGNHYRVDFNYGSQYRSSINGASSNTSVQFAEAPACNVSLGLIDLRDLCDENPELITTCFVVGATENSDLETIIGFEHNFGENSQVNKYASHSETGSVWGIAWKSQTSEIFSSAFVKQYAGLTEHGHGAIFKTTVGPNGNSTSLYADLAASVGVGAMVNTNITDCKYGSQVGKIGLGSMVLDPDGDYLFVTNLGKNSIVKISTTDPTDITEYPVEDPGCSNGEYKPFALKYYNDKIYVGVTCYAQSSASESDSKAIIYEWDVNGSGLFSNIFETNYILGYWKDVPSSSISTSHWFTDIDFSDEGNIIIGLSDRIGHRYCKSSTKRLDTQSPDILLVYQNKDGDWTLEHNGAAGAFTGTGQNNGDGPGNGEFFAFDHWPLAATHHNETAIGSFFVLEGSGEVVVAVYDPADQPYAGGFHRYKTIDGTHSEGDFIELYARNSSTQFGKATGFGDIVSKCGVSTVQIGNFVWEDTNNNGIQDAGEQAVEGLTINLLDDQCNIIDTKVTDANGNYLFNDLIPNQQYYVALPSSTLDDTYGLINVNNNTYTFASKSNSDSYVNSDASILDVDCGKVIIPIITDHTNHSFDIGLVTPGGFDLALKKEILNKGIIHVGEKVTFRITVYNQGGIPAKNVKISDYVPSGYDYNYLDNPTWKYEDNIATTTIGGTIIPGGEKSVTIDLTLNTADINQLVNIAEISSATNHNDEFVTDDDSKMDSNPTNDNGGQVGTGTDDEVTDDGTFDEDDHDPAVPAIFDLALRQFYSNNECVTGGSDITISTNVFNQGNTPAKSFKVANYGAPNLVFDEDKNPEWIEEDGTYIYTGGTMAPGTNESIDLVFSVVNLSQSTDVINYAEIAESIPVGSNKSEDSDSKPDDVDDNDAGGDPYNSEDNYIDGNEGVEEDDHDPIVINSRIVDLALTLTTQERQIVEGQEVCFEINIYNQGQMPIKAVNLVDYLPSTLVILDDSEWEWLIDNTYTKSVSFDPPLAPGARHMENICVEVGNIDGVFAIENYAEIGSITGLCDDDLSQKDRDSKADTNNTNDNGGRPQTNTDDSINETPSVDEDDHDPAILLNVQTTIEATCIEHACPTEPGNGLFRANITINAPRNMVWNLDQALGLYDLTSSNDNLIDVIITSLKETYINDSESAYTFSGVYESGKDYELRFKSEMNDYTYVSGNACTYDRKVVTGPVALCSAGDGTYSIPRTGSETYTPSVVGGMITSTSNGGTQIEVTFDGVDSDNEVRFTRDGADCEDPAVLRVATGNSDLAMKCRSSSNLSLDDDCAVEILPRHIIAGTPDPEAAYAVMINLNGTPIPNNIVDASHVGKTIEVKLIEGCSGNSCWGNITIEDKMAPTIICEDVTVSCYKIPQYRGPVALDNCGEPITLNTLDSIYNKVNCDPNNNGTFIKFYQAIDAQGNKSTVCEQEITIAKVELDSVKFPASFTMANALACQGLDLDNNGNPIATLTGLPTLDGLPVYPNFENFCNLTTTYSDEGPYPFGCAQKLIRTWTVWDLSCLENPGKVSMEQTVIMGDREDPTFTCPDSITVSASFADCEARVRVPAATDFMDDCATDFQVDITYPGGSRLDQNGGYDIMVPVGVHYLGYRVIDQCQRFSTCQVKVRVEDKTAPLAICDQNSTISLLSTGTTYMYPQTLDDGSYDACGIVSFEARRMDLGSACGVNENAFGSVIDFCCADVSDTIPVIVELRVTDSNNNTNTCMVNVFVQDKTKPTIQCPHDREITCLDHYDINDLGEFGTAIVDDACGASLDSMAIDSVNQCRVGFITRIFTATDGANTVSCQQRINVVNKDTFNINSVIRPEDFTTFDECSGLSLHPDSLSIERGRPRFNDGICEMLSSTWRDKVYNFTDNDGTCFKIIRTWTVINNCIKRNGVYDEVKFDQVIKVNNTVPPMITSDLSKVTVPLLAGSCDEGMVPLSAEGHDTCTPDDEIQYAYQIYINGVLDPSRSRSGEDYSVSASGIYPLGEHFILWSFEDKCGNVVTERQDFSVIDDNKPTAGCLQSVSIALTPMDTDSIVGVDTEMACIGPDSLNASSSHPCQDLSDLTFSFDSLGTLNELCFDCFDLGPNTIDFYVIDLDGDYDICQVVVEVQDNNDVDFCPDPEQCITWPDSLVEIFECLPDTSVAALGMPSVVDTCICDMFGISYTNSPVVYDNKTCDLFERTWTVEFMCGDRPLVYQFAQMIKQYNVVAPKISCPDDITVDANASCVGVVTNLPDATFSEDGCSTNVQLSFSSNAFSGMGGDANGNYPFGNTVITYTVVDSCNNSSQCMTNIFVRDVLPPMAECVAVNYEVELDPDGFYILTQSDVDAISAGSMDNCDQTPNITVSPIQFDCNDVDNPVQVEVLIIDDGGLRDSCFATVEVSDDTSPEIECVAITRALDGNGDYTMTTTDLDIITAGSSDACTFEIVPITLPTYTCTELGLNTLTITIEDPSGNDASCEAMITIEDNELPTVECNDITVDLPANSNTVTLSSAQQESLVANANDNCTIDTIYNPITFDCSNVNVAFNGNGPNDVTVTVTDQSNNSADCIAEVTVQDVTDPVASCLTTYTVMLNSMLMASLTSVDLAIITDGSSDNCSFVASTTAMFTCDDLGSNNPTVITLTDPSGNDTDCTVNITVEDAGVPTLMCSDITVSLDATGNHTLSTMDSMALVMASDGTCGTSVTIDQSTFDCTHVPSEVILITLFDAQNNQIDNCTPTVTVQDVIAPEAECTNITVNLVGNSYALNPTDIANISNGSDDACMPLTFTVVPNTFNCGDVGNQTVLLTVTDPSANSDTCSAIVAVVDNTPPTAVCADITITLDANLMYTFSTADLETITAGSSDNCDFTPSATRTFSCSDVGIVNDVQITLTDPSNLTTTCLIDVTVEDAGTPTLTCSDISVFLDANGDHALTMADSMALGMGNGISCGTTLTISQTDFDCSDVPSTVITITLFDAQNNQIDQCMPTVTVTDTIDPSAVCNDITVMLVGSTYTLSTADTAAIANGSTDACGLVSLSVTPSAFDCANIGQLNPVMLTVTDVNNNTSVCSANVTVEDGTTIAAVCDSITVTVMEGQNYQFTAADSLSIFGGTTDNCDFSVQFVHPDITCADTMSVVSLTVNFFDSQGSQDTTCTVDVFVESNNELVCRPQNVTVYLDSLGGYGLTAEDVDGGSGAGCNASVDLAIDIDSLVCNDVSNPTGVLVTLTVTSGSNSESCEAFVTVIDTIAPEITCRPLITIACDTFDGNFNSIVVIDSIWDNCTEYVETVDTLINVFNDCGLGTFTRDFIATDILSGLADTCNVVISVINTSDPLTLADFSLPQDTTIDNCVSSGPASTGFVTLNGAVPSCSFVEIDFVDNPPMLPGNCIDTLVRSWSIEDTCNNVSLSYDQTIIVIDTIAPDLVAISDTIFIANPNSDCELAVDLSAVIANLDCTDNNTTYTNNSIYADDSLSIDASGTYPAGTTTTITVIATDCLGADTISYVLDIEEAMYVFSCDKVIVPIDTITSTVCVAVTDLASATGMCTTTFELMVRKENETTLVDTLKYDCTELGDNVVYVYLTINGVVVDSCTDISSGGRTLVTVLDPTDHCTNTISIVSGTISTHNSVKVPDVEVQMLGSELPKIMTDKDGGYAFPEMPSGGAYKIIPQKDDGLLEGVSTLDLILIQRHILDIDPLSNVYSIIAADINNDQRVRTSDLVDLRKALLGATDRFTNNTSWKMVDRKYEFPVADDPFAEIYPTDYNLDPLNGKMLVDFVGVKIGDVNGSFEGLRSSNTENRSSMSMISDDLYINKGESSTITLSLEEAALYGLQFGVEINGLTKVESVEIENTNMDFEYNIVGQTILFSLSDAQLVDVKDMNVVINFTSSIDGRASDIVSLNDTRMANEAYGADFVKHNINLSWRSLDLAAFRFDQNKPNPWTDKTFLSFDLPIDDDVEITITDVTGATLYTKTIAATKGANRVEISDTDVSMKSGVFLVTLNVKGLRLQQKMIRLN